MRTLIERMEARRLLTAAAGHAVASAAAYTVSVGTYYDADGGKDFDDNEPGYYGRTVYIDSNDNGALDSGEPSTTTNVEGFASFALAAGQYTFREVLPAGYTETDVSVFGAGGMSSGRVVTLAGTATFRSVYFASSPDAGVATLRGTILNDVNRNGAIDSGDTPFANVSYLDPYLDLDGNGVYTLGEPLYTGSGPAVGAYSFANVPPGAYRVGLTDPSAFGTNQVLPANDGLVSVTAVGGQTATIPSILVSDGQPAPTTGFINISAFTDANGNGVLDSGEAFESSADTVYLDLNRNGQLDSGEPNKLLGDSVASFTEPPGTYLVRLVPKDIHSVAEPADGVAVTVTAGAVSSAQFGVKKLPTPGTASISGAVYGDANLNETFDATEAGLAGRTVYLDANGNGQLDAGETSVVSGAGGAYGFTQLAAGNYLVRTVVPSGMIDTATGAPSAITLSSGEAFTDLDLGVADARIATVTGRIFYDANRDGVFDEGDYGLDGDVYVDTNHDGSEDAGDAFLAFSDRTTGAYSLRLPATGGTYTLQLDGTNGFSPTTPLSVTITPQAGTGYAANFGLGPAATASTLGVSGTVYADTNKNYKRDAGEPGVALAHVFVDLNNNGVLDDSDYATYTNASGVYNFPMLPATGKTATVRLVLPGGYTQKFPNANGGYAITLTAKANLAGKDFGVVPGSTPPPASAGSISGFVFDDTNKDGLYESTETKTSGKTVFLDTNNNGKLDSGEKSVVTGSGGVWSFTGLAAGTYHVRRVFPSGYTQSNTLLDVTLTAGQTVSGLSIGSRSGGTTPPPPANTASIAGFAFNDVNRNGLYDGTDTLASGKTIFLDTNNDGLLDNGELSLVTDSKGAFTFKNLAAGTYHVRRVEPSGYVESTPLRTLTLTAGQASTGVSIGSKTK